MKALMLALLAAAPLAALAQNRSCWEDGYRKGYCDGRNQGSFCVAPMAPTPPTPRLGREDCETRYEDGYRAGEAAGRRS